MESISLESFILSDNVDKDINLCFNSEISQFDGLRLHYDFQSCNITDHGREATYLF